MQSAIQVLHAYIVDVEIVACRDRTNSVENVFSTLSARYGVDNDVGIRQDAVNRPGFTGGWWA
jgi:hypothetical protein